MKKYFAALLIFLMLTPAALAAPPDGPTQKGVFGRIGAVMLRGAVNFLTSPYEFVRTYSGESSRHHWLWPFTGLPRGFTNFMVRATSGAHDAIFFPWYLPFTDDISPWTEPFDLPEYVWQKQV